MIEQLAKEELGDLGFPRLYVDHVLGRLPASLSVPRFFGKKQREEFETGVATVGEKPFWREVLEYNTRLGASEVSLRSIERLSEGRAVPVVTGQQPGLLGGPLYTLYKVLTAVSLAELLSKGGASRAKTLQHDAPQVVPVFWNASDDSDFDEVASATFFQRDLSLKKFSVATSNHLAGNMVGAMSTEALNVPIETLMHDFEKSPGTALLMSFIEDGLAVARDWGEFFSALFLHLFSSYGVVVVDARLPSVAKYSTRVMNSYLREASSIEIRVADCLKELKERGYTEPVSLLSGETCVFLKDGMARKKVSKYELPAIADLWSRGDVELLPNVLLGPVVRDELMGPVANVVGPSEASYYIVGRVLYDALGFQQRPIFPRLSLTILSRDLTFLVGGDPSGFKKLVLSFEKVTRSYFEKEIPPEVAGELETLERQMRYATERMSRLAAASSKSTAEVAASASRKIDFELGRVREGFIAAYKKRALNERPILRKAGDFLLPKGGLQERSLCSLAPLVYGGEVFVKTLEGVARTHVLDALEGQVRHYIASVAIP